MSKEGKIFNGLWLEYVIVCSGPGVPHEMPQVTIAPDVLAGNTRYRLTADVTAPGSDVATDTFDFWVAAAPDGGMCQVTSDQGAINVDLCD